MTRRLAIAGILALTGLVFQSGQALADARDLLDHVQRQKQEQRQQGREQRHEAREESSRNRDEQRDQREPGRRHRQDYQGEGFRGISPGEAARRAQQRNGGGRVLGVNPIDDGYNVRLLKQGEVRTFMIPETE